MYEIELSSFRPVDSDLEDRLRQGVERILREARIDSAEISLAVVDDPTIHRLNRIHLAHDYPTDVLSFCLAEGPSGLEGEIIVSWDRAVEVARQYGWSAEDELLLYVIHGALHLVGYDDHQPEDLEKMRAGERRHLEGLGRVPPLRVEEARTLGVRFPSRLSGHSPDCEGRS
jgi:probable rRNA maturation factor